MTPLDFTNETNINEENCVASGSDWMMRQEDSLKVSSNDLFLANDVSEFEDSECGVKRTHSSAFSTSDLLLSIVDIEVEAPSIFSSIDSMDVIVGEEEQEIVETLFDAKWEQESIRAGPTFLPTFSFTSFADLATTLKNSVKRTHSNGLSTSDLLLSTVDREEEAPLILSSVDSTNAIVREEEQERVETLFDGEREQESTRARPTFLPTFSLSSFADLASFGSNSILGSHDKVSNSTSNNGGTNGTDWNSMFYNLLSPPTTSSKPEPEVTEFSEMAPPTMSTKPEPEVTESSETEHSTDSIPNLAEEEKLSSSQKPTDCEIQTKEFIEKPTTNDVMLGRGARSNRHRGNIVYRQLVEDNKMRYKDCPKLEKTKMSRLLVDKIQQEHHGRFLCLDQAEKKWYVVPDAVARRKVSQALREINTPEFRAAKRRKYSTRKGEIASP